MKTRKYILLVLAALVLAACGTKKALTVKPAQKPAWHTCLIQGARATVTKGSDRVSATVTMQTVRDSMIIISVMPMLGIEMLRLEATPQELIAIDKIHGQYTTTDFKQLNHKLTPRLNWTVLQQISSADGRRDCPSAVHLGQRDHRYRARLHRAQTGCSASNEQAAHRPLHQN